MLEHNQKHKLSYIFDNSRAGEKDIRQVQASAHLKLRWRRPSKDNNIQSVENVFTLSPLNITLPLIEPRVIVGKFLYAFLIATV